jgi:tRNA G18 (ribose-2'-O)-methylase SpoU
MNQRVFPIPTLDDPRVAPYRNLKDRDLAREGGRFIAEGELVVRRLLASAFQTESLLIADRKLEEIEPIVPPHIPIYCAPADVVNRIIGFKFHSGVMAVGLRGPRPTLEQLASKWQQERITLVILPQVQNTENLGSMIRISSGLGASAMILGERSCDPWYRQSIRVSMGTVFSLPIVQSNDLLSDLKSLRERWGAQLIATVLDDQAEDLACAARAPRIAVLFGNEVTGLSPQEIAACDRKVTIPMNLGTDSLNVSVAAGIILYHFTRVRPA